MELKHIPVLAVVALAAAACSGSKSSEPPADPYAGLTKEQKIEKIQNDKTLSDFARQSKLADLQNGK
jgi:hypothetical protein